MAAYSSMSCVQRTHRPVGALVGLVQLQAEMAVEQRRQPEPLVAEELRADRGVDEVAHREAEVAVQDAQVVVAAVEDLR